MDHAPTPALIKIQIHAIQALFKLAMLMGHALINLNPPTPSAMPLTVNIVLPEFVQIAPLAQAQDIERLLLALLLVYVFIL